MRSISLALITAALASCATAPQPMDARSPEGEAQLQRLIAGRSAGPPMSCLPGYNSRRSNMTAIDDNTIAFRTGSGGDVYVSNVTSGGCGRLGSGLYTLVTRTTGSSLCSGDIANVTDLRTGVIVGSCAIGEFTPYRR
jgi:hypothetical protein